MPRHLPPGQRVFLLVRTALPINGSIVIVLLPAVWNFPATCLI
jgi:hypothetical protein